MLRFWLGAFASPASRTNSSRSPTNAVATASSCSREVSSSGSPMPSVSRLPDVRRCSVSCRFRFRNGNASARARQSTKSSTRGSTPGSSTRASNLARRSVTTSRPMWSVTCAASVGSATCRASGASCVSAPGGSGSCSTSARLVPTLEFLTRNRARVAHSAGDQLHRFPATAVSRQHRKASDKVAQALFPQTPPADARRIGTAVRRLRASAVSRLQLHLIRQGGSTRVEFPHAARAQ